MGKKKILYIHHGWGVGGAPLSLLYLVRNLDKTKYIPLVLFTHINSNDEIIELFRKENIKVLFETRHNKYFGHHVKGHLKYYQLAKTIRIIIDWFYIAFKIAQDNYKYIKPDLIHLNSDVLTNWAYAGHKLGVPVVCHNRDPISRGVFGVRRIVLKKILSLSVSRIVSISHDNKKRMGLPKITVVIYNPVPVGFFQDYKHTENKEKRILFLGGSHSSKGINLLLQAVKYLNQDIKVILAGYFPVKNGLNNLINYKRRKLLELIKKNESQLEIIGVINNEEVIKEMQKADLVVFPAKHSHFGRPIIESYATKTPVIATNIKGMDEIVFDCITGYLVEQNAIKWGRKINEVIYQTETLIKLGNAGYKFACKNFNSENYAKKVELIYQEILCVE